MKQFLTIVSLFFLLWITACKPEKAPDNLPVENTAIAVPNNENEIIEVVTAFNKALIDRDREQLERLCSEYLSYGHSSGVVQDKAAFIEDLVSGPFRFLTINTPEQTIHLEGNTAVVRHILEADGSRNGEAVDLRIGNLLIYKKTEDNSWKLWVRQAYKL
ncbi:nuclear transport factor 2 family protein [Arenibacter sp. GZD96]|uniref:nuclear transport factor 2 family protein n=1 Tax=Aurantibrevibacter litoralis TaxID=3106030 RepID=UPI002AFF720F|nr:nuclear transport factor 2 family protein [Arenibacter sp. GZD-96]MEA1785728.1 nuclear transport factor 2 family protein [Arenibacter sp. GZD-96]